MHKAGKVIFRITNGSAFFVLETFTPNVNVFLWTLKRVKRYISRVDSRSHCSSVWMDFLYVVIYSLNSELIQHVCHPCALIHRQFCHFVFLHFWKASELLNSFIRSFLYKSHGSCDHDTVILTGIENNFKTHFISLALISCWEYCASSGSTSSRWWTQNKHWPYKDLCDPSTS